MSGDSSGDDSSSEESLNPDADFDNENGPNSNGQNSNGPNSNGPNSNGPNSNGPNSNGPNSNGPNSNGPNSNGPNSNGPLLLLPMPMDVEPEDNVSIWEECEEFIKEQIGESPDMKLQRSTEARNRRLQKLYRTMSFHLPASDAKNLRLLSRKVNYLLINDKPYMKRFKTQFRTSWYKNYPAKLTLELCPRWNEVKLKKFLFYRRKQEFIAFWQSTARFMETLKIEKGSFECDGLKFLIDFAPNLASLELKNCKLRDKDDFHGNLKRSPVTTDPVPARTNSIRSLHIESLNAVDTCFMDYLVSIIDSLEEFTMSYCFIGEAEIGAPATELYFKSVSPILALLINTNSRTLKKMTFRGNYGQMSLLNRLVTPHSSLNPTHLSLALLSPTQQNGPWGPAYAFIQQRCSKLVKLDLQILEYVPSQELATLIEAFRVSGCPLQTLKLDIIGNPRFEEVHLTPFLQSLTQLKQLIVSDSKKLDPRIKYLVGGIRYHKYRLHNFSGVTPLQVDQICHASLTNLQPNFMSNLPHSLTEFCLKRYITSTNYFVESLNNNIQSYKRLTKLEIHGPWIHPMNEVIPKILNLKQLETLALDNCNVQDMFITGLGWEAVMDLRRAVVYIFGLPQSGNDIAHTNLIDVLDKAPNFRGLQATLREPRKKLSDMPKLKYLDLSSNPQISDLGIYDSMKLPHVETLVLNSCRRITDIGLELIGVNFPKLKTLSIKHCRKISQFGLNEMVKNYPNIQTIYTTQVIRNTEFHGFSYPLCERYASVVQTSIGTTTEGFIHDEEY